MNDPHVAPEHPCAAGAEAASRRQRKLVFIALAMAAAATVSLTFAAWQSVRLAHSSGRQTEFLVQAVTAPDDHFPTGVEHLREHRDGAVTLLRQILDDPCTPPSQKGKAALALAAFGDLDALRPALALAEDPSARTMVIHGYRRVHGDLTEAARALQMAKTDPDRPVQQVSWFEAVAFCNWLSRREGLTPCYSLTKTGLDEPRDWQCDLVPKANGYRLPSEAQWEYACRAVSQAQYAFGDDERLLGEYAWYRANASRETWPAGDKLPNGWGLFDMHGNVREWCEDWYGAYPVEEVTDPRGPTGAARWVFRGGCWWDDDRHCRAAYRGGDWPGDRDVHLGFRVAAVPLGRSSQ